MEPIELSFLTAQSTNTRAAIKMEQSQSTPATFVEVTAAGLPPAQISSPATTGAQKLSQNTTPLETDRPPKNRQTSASTGGGSEGGIRKKRKYRSRVRTRSPETVTRLKRVRRGKANDRERNRMHSLNHALETLRDTLPTYPEDTKLTKIETLKMALNYISLLQELLDNPAASDQGVGASDGVRAGLGGPGGIPNVGAGSGGCSSMIGATGASGLLLNPPATATSPTPSSFFGGSPSGVSSTPGTPEGARGPSSHGGIEGDHLMTPDYSLEPPSLPQVANQNFPLGGLSEGDPLSSADFLISHHDVRGQPQTVQMAGHAAPHEAWHHLPTPGSTLGDYHQFSSASHHYCANIENHQNGPGGIEFQLQNPQIAPAQSSVDFHSSMTGSDLVNSHSVAAYSPDFIGFY